MWCHELVGVTKREFDDLNFLQEGDMPDMDLAGDLNQMSQTNGSDEWTRESHIKLIFNTDSQKL